MIGILLLAAGASTRMGQSKQLLTIAGEQLLLRSTRVAMESEADIVMVVLGANELAHRNVIEQLPVEIIVNADWQKGMGSSLKKGLAQLLKIVPQLDAVMMMVCDQPLLTTKHLNELIQSFKKTKRLIVASHYSGAAGVPALFEKSLFEKLLNVENESGAKKIIQQHIDVVQTVDFTDGKFDLDTPDDFRGFVDR